MSSKRILEGLAVIAVLLLAYAWYDGGEEPLRNISEPVAVPANVTGGA